MVPRFVLFSVLSSSTMLWFVDVKVWKITNMRVSNDKTNELLNLFFFFFLSSNFVMYAKW
jgi:hypothetical protein